MKRDNFSQLPNTKELGDILDAETSRDLPKGNESFHYFDFSSLINLAKHFGIDADILTSEYTKEDISSEDLLDKGKSFIKELKEKVLDQELSVKDIKILNNVYDYLSEEDNLKQSDFIFVFGSKTPLRIEKAIELYNQGLSEKIIVSGQGPHYADNVAETEAEIYARIAMNAGVPKESIIKEDKSITIPDNVRSSLNLLDKISVPYKSIILVNSPYTQRRGWAHFKKYTPDSTTLIRINSETGDNYKRDFWYKNSLGIDVVIGEFFKVKVAVSLNTA